MPQLGETVTEGTISRWYKSVGDDVVAGEPLFDIETDKTSMEVPSVVGGTLREIRAQEGETVGVGVIVAVLAERGMAEPAAQAAASSPAATPAPAAIAAPVDPFHGLRTPTQWHGAATLAGGVKITPRARRLAAEAHLDVTQLWGSGPRGRIVAADVHRWAGESGTPAAAAAPAPAAATDAVRALYRDVPHREIPLDGVRRQIARRLSESKQQVPHFYLGTDVRVESLLALRQQFNASSGQRVSVNDVLVRAYALALQQVPAANVIWAGDALLQLERVDVGVAVALPGGLVTPIVRRADTLGLAALAAELAALIGRARERKLQPAEYNGGSATVSNLGMYGVRSFQAIVNPPQATILALGAVERRVIEAPDGTLRGASLLSVSLSVDHRAVDGAKAAELLAAFRTVVENPLRIFE